MNPIPTKFKEGVFLHKLITGWYNPNKPNDPPIAIYEKTDSSKPRGYEVVRFQLRKAESVTVKGTRYDYPERFVYPSNEQWGTHGFSCVTLQDAEIRLQRMIAWSSQDSATSDKVQAALPITDS